MNENTHIKTKTYAAHYFQNSEQWQVSQDLLTSLNKVHSLKDEIQDDIHAQTINTDVLINYTQYLLATIRQTHHESGEDANKVRNQCELLFMLTNKVIGQSHYPLFLQAHVFAGYCLNNQSAVAEQRRQLALMKVPLPHYFTNINKELINDNNTTKL